MPRELTSHKVNGCNDQIKIEVLDEPGSGGANHRYDISGFHADSNPSASLDPILTTNEGDGSRFSKIPIIFQNGPIGEVGVNGVTHEILLAILIDRIEGFQRGKFATIENQIALDHLRAAQSTLKFRTQQRLARGVEGTHKV